jgi:hypothetical protein
VQAAEAHKKEFDWMKKRKENAGRRTSEECHEPHEVLPIPRACREGMQSISEWQDFCQSIMYLASSATVWEAMIREQGLYVPMQLEV